MFRIGAQPPHAKLFAGELTDDDADGWGGIERTVEELDFLRDEITRTVEEVGGKVRIQITHTVSSMTNVLADIRSVRYEEQPSSTDIITPAPPSSKRITHARSAVCSRR